VTINCLPFSDKYARIADKSKLDKINAAKVQLPCRLIETNVDTPLFENVNIV